jgi:hypothetical protein
MDLMKSRVVQIYPALYVQNIGNKKNDTEHKENAKDYPFFRQIRFCAFEDIQSG